MGKTCFKNKRVSLTTKPAAMTIEFKLKLPPPPNFIAVEGMEKSIPIESLTEEQARQYAEEMRMQVIEHWREKRGALIPRTATKTITNP